MQAGDVHIKTGHDTVSTTRLTATSPAELEIAVQRMMQDIARQSAEVHLLEYEPFNALPV